MEIKEENNQEAKLTEKISLKFRKQMIVNTLITILLMAVLVASYMALNLWIEQQDLPSIDVTKSKIFTLSDESKEVIKNIDQDIMIYTYGFEQDSSFMRLLAQYKDTNSRIEYKTISNDGTDDLELIKKYDLQPGYTMVIMKSGESEKVIDPNSEFYTYDQYTYETIDITEQTVTNSILALTNENKPNVYFLTGHNEYSLGRELVLLGNFLTNESFNVKELDLMTAGTIPEDCDVLAIISPKGDIVESEAAAIKDYIAKGGSIYFALTQEDASVTNNNIQQVLDEYGVAIQVGYILEGKEGYYYATQDEQYPYVFRPQVNETNKITSKIYSSGFMWLAAPQRVIFKADDELANLNVTKETLLSSSEESGFMDGVSQTVTPGESVISAALTKTVGKNENGEDITSKLIICSTATFMSDGALTPLSTNYPLSYLANNKDFSINAMSYLGGKDNSLEIRKDIASTSYIYVATPAQTRVVLAIIFFVPLAIIGLGVVVWNFRKKRK